MSRKRFFGILLLLLLLLPGCGKSPDPETAALAEVELLLIRRAFHLFQSSQPSRPAPAWSEKSPVTELGTPKSMLTTCADGVDYSRT